MRALVIFIGAIRKAVFAGIAAGVKAFVACCLVAVSYFAIKILILLPVQGVWVNKSHVVEVFDESLTIISYVGITAAAFFFVVTCIARFTEEY